MNAVRPPEVANLTAAVNSTDLNQARDLIADVGAPQPTTGTSYVASVNAPSQSGGKGFGRG